MVRPEVRDLAAAVVPPEAEVVVDAVLVVWPLRRWPEPEVVVELGRRIAVGRHFLGIVRTWNADQHRLQLANASATNQLASAVEAGVAALLRAGLHDSLVCPRRFDHLPSFDDGQRER